MAGYVWKGGEPEPVKNEPNPAENRRRNNNRPANPLPATLEKLKQAEQLFAAGASQNQVRKQLGLSPSTIRQYLPGKGWTKAQGAQYTLAHRKRKAG